MREPDELREKGRVWEGQWEPLPLRTEVVVRREGGRGKRARACAVAPTGRSGVTRCPCLSCGGRVGLCACGWVGAMRAGGRRRLGTYSCARRVVFQTGGLTMLRVAAHSVADEIAHHLGVAHTHT